ncbi:MAG: Fur family transcriptional regulator [Acidimicrobiales bacterium]
MRDRSDLHTTAAARLRRDDQRYTRNRRALVDALAGADRPLTIQEVLSARAELAQSSSYRNLAVLERSGVVRRVVSSDDFARYELAEDLTGHHHHLICSSCGAVEDFTVPTRLERNLEHALDKVMSDTGFSADHHRLDLVGTCAACD